MGLTLSRARLRVLFVKGFGTSDELLVFEATYHIIPYKM